MKFRLNMVAKKAGVGNYYPAAFSKKGWEENKLFDIPEEEVFGVNAPYVIVLTCGDDDLGVYTEDLILMEPKPLSEWL